MKLEEKTIDEEILYKGRIITLKNDKVELPNGHTSAREYVTHPGGVGVVALTEDGEVLLVRQFRYPYKSLVLEIPAGKLDPGEDPLSCGKRELREETGAAAQHYKSLGQLLPSPGYTNEIIHMYLAQGLTYGKQDTDDDEFLKVEKIPFKKAVDMVMENEIKDSKTQIALLKAFIILNGIS